MPIDPNALLTGLKPILKLLEADLLARAKDPAVERGLKTSWEREKAASRTGDSFAIWRRGRCVQVGIAWVLSTIFVRTLEDRGFLERNRVAGPGAQDSEHQFTALAPFLTARDYLRAVFGELSTLPGAADLFDRRHNPVWLLAPSADAARKLLDFFRQPDAHDPSRLRYQFAGDDTRFLGDLYQNLNEDVRKRFALLQTPVFVEEFILEQTLDPAVRTFGLADVTLIDPTCGSGHFLLGAFHRLFDLWLAQAPGEDRAVLALRALNQVYGCDLNPYAVAIARFRLTLEFLQATQITQLARAPKLGLNLCVADSLLHGVANTPGLLAAFVDDEAKEDWLIDQLFALEDASLAERLLKRRYHAVVGNPPYITEKDAKKRERYRQLYVSAAGKFALAAPFTERFFGLAVPAGFVGMINANSFTKRDFGKPLIEQVLPRLDVTKVVDTSGAYIPGHGTPTLLLFGRNRPAGADDVVAVLGIRGEAEEPADPATAPVWSEIVQHHEEDGFDGRYVSVETIARPQMAEHPWVLSGGGARKLKESLEQRADSLLGELSESIGYTSILGQDEVFLFPEHLTWRKSVDGSHVHFVTGEDVRDWVVDSRLRVVFPYESLAGPAIRDAATSMIRPLWPYRTSLAARLIFGATPAEKGMVWYEHIYRDRPKLRIKLSLTFPFVATHNHFVLDRGGRLFNRHAPVVKLKEQYDEDDHLALLGLLNSSVACFWMKMVFFDKGSSSGGTIRRESWEPFFEFDGTKLKKFPVATAPEVLPYSQHLDRIASERQTDTVTALLETANTTDADTLRGALDTRRARDLAQLEQMVGLQEELDWLCYRVYGLATEVRVLDAEAVPGLRPGHRPFELEWASTNEPTDWFTRHGWQASTSLPDSYSSDYRALVAQRRQLTVKNKSLQLVEQPNYKRRWYFPDYEEQEKNALQSFLLDRLETLFDGTAQSARQLAAELQRDPKALAVAEVYSGESAPDLEKLVGELVKNEGVPYLAALRYSDSGLEKHAAWRETWALQRREDAGEAVGEIAVPPKYDTKDFRGSVSWTHRGKLDVPKERFILYPGAETDTDGSPWLGWAGWDHQKQATALSALYQQRKNEEGWEGEKLAPLLAGLHELVPWLQQWHNEPDATYGGMRLGDTFRDFVASEARVWGLSTADLEAWRPLAAVRGRRAAAGNASPGVSRKRAAGLSVEALVGQFVAGVERAQSDLAEALGVSSAAVGKVAAEAVEGGVLVVTSGRPKRWRLG